MGRLVVSFLGNMMPTTMTPSLLRAITQAGVQIKKAQLEQQIGNILHKAEVKMMEAARDGRHSVEYTADSEAIRSIAAFSTVVGGGKSAEDLIVDHAKGMGFHAVYRHFSGHFLIEWSASA